MAHSDIFLCGQSSDAILAARVDSVIKEKKGVVKAFFFLEQLGFPENILISLHADARPARTKKRNVREIGLRQVEKNVYSTRAKNGQQSIVKNKHKSQRKLQRQPLLLLFHLSSFSLPCDSSPLPGPGKVISRSHT